MNPEPVYPVEYYQNSLDALTTALNYLDAYKHWRQFDPGPGYPIDIRFAALPALTKEAIRKYFPAGFVPQDKDIGGALKTGEIEFVKTSGSIDMAVTNIWYQKWWDASEKASWKLNSHADRLATGHHREAILVNPMNVGIISDDKPLSMQERRLARFLYLNERTSPALWTSEHMDRMVDELNIFQPAILEANPSLLAKFCRYLAVTGRKVFQPGLITFTYEFPAAFQIRQIKKVFNVPTASSYGSTETGYVFMQCEAGKFHQNTEVCRVDFQPLKKEHGGPAVGRILVTPFHNPWYYLLRFYVGDLVRLDLENRCFCGRNQGLILSAIEGRAFSVTLTTGGRLVTLREVDDVISRFEQIDEYKIEQTAPANYRLKLVVRSDNKSKLNKQIDDALKSLYGDEAVINLTYEDMILPESSGKHCLAKTTFPIQIEDYLEN